MGKAEETAINKSIENLEYEMANAIRKCLIVKPQKIAFLYGHGEPDDAHLDDLMSSLSDNYAVDRFFFNLRDEQFLRQFIGDAENIKDYDSLGALVIRKTLRMMQQYDGVVIVKPIDALDKDEAYILDQYIMHGGKTIWMVDPLMAEQDSLRRNPKVNWI